MKRKDHIKLIREKLQKKGYFPHGGGYYHGRHFPRGILKRTGIFKRDTVYAGKDWITVQKIIYGVIK